MLTRIKNKKGETNLLLIIVVMGFAAMLIFLFAVAVFVSQINSILYTVKVDMFLINRSAIIALNKEAEKRDILSINRNDYYNYFKKVLRYNYDLDEDLKNENRLIERIDILEYEYDTAGEPTIKTKIGVKVTPIVFKKVFSDIFYFKINQDIKVSKVLK